MTHGGVVALVSGGVESLCLVQGLLRSGATVSPLYLRCGLGWEQVELLRLKRWLARIRHPRLKPLVVLQVPVHSVYQHHWSITSRGVPSARSRDAAVYLPGRNVLLLSHAALYAAGHGLSTLAMGTLGGNPFRDASPGFLKRFAGVLSEALSRPMRILTPLRRFTKPQLVSIHAAQPLHLTFSCIRPRGRVHCGRCNKCAERQRAFRQAGLPDPTIYARWSA